MLGKESSFKMKYFNGPLHCNICQKPGHKAEMCPNGHVNWLEKLGSRAFRLRPQTVWSEDRANPNNRRGAHANLVKLEKAAKDFALRACQSYSMSYQDIIE